MQQGQGERTQQQDTDRQAPEPYLADDLCLRPGARDDAQAGTLAGKLIAQGQFDEVLKRRVEGGCRQGRE